MIQAEGRIGPGLRTAPLEAFWFGFFLAGSWVQGSYKNKVYFTHSGRMESHQIVSFKSAGVLLDQADLGPF